MEHWHQPNIPPVKAGGEDLWRSSRVLSLTSGNAQSYALDFREGVENKDPVSGTSLQRTDLKSAPSQYNPQVLVSNHRGSLQHLNARRQRHGNGLRHGHRPQGDPPRPYLTCEKYLAYRNRRRFDSGKDGAPVWDSTTEEAFQDALVRIVPMGRRKRTQHGKLYGRNELIAEYIYQRTGEVRTRKQVSSHIQVLNDFLKEIPEWKALIKAIDDANNPNDHQYYDTSIRDMVHGGSHGSQHVPNLYPNTAYANGLPPPEFTLGSNSEHTEKHCIAKLNFVMWVSPPNPAPNQMTDQLHRYTEVQCCDSSSQPAPLESTKNWRMSFPHLASIAEHTSLSQCCEVILLEASFRLMQDFPPPSCKLGINLELDFRHPMANVKALNELHGWKWICITRMYEHGKCCQQTQHHCDLKRQKMEIGKVAPSFESKYWAEKFINLIERKRGAEESGNDAAISAANEKSRNFFSGLSAMQELVAYAPDEVPLLETQSKPPQGKRMAVLLWKFSQAQAGHVGITSWQRLIPPPLRHSMNSPPPAQDAALPPLMMDTMVDDIHVDPSFSMYTETPNQQSEHAPHQFCNTNIGDDNSLMIHHGYDMDFNNDELGAFTGIQSSFDMPLSHGDLSQSNFPGLGHFSFDYQPHEVSFGHHDSPQPSTNGFELRRSHQSPKEGESSSGLLIVPPAHRLPELSRHLTAEEQDGQRQPLSDFDHNTHRILQAQLDQVQPHDHDAEEKTLLEALAAASAMSDLGAPGHSQFLVSPQQQRPLHEPERAWDMPFASRPPLPHCSSYASQQSHHSAVDEHLPVVFNQEASEANQFVSILQSHNSIFDVSINSIEHHANNQSVSIPNDIHLNIVVDSTPTSAGQTSLKPEGTDGHQKM